MSLYLQCEHVDMMTYQPHNSQVLICPVKRVSEKSLFLTLQMPSLSSLKVQQIQLQAHTCNWLLVIRLVKSVLCEGYHK